MSSTPLIKFADVFLKREDLNPTGSAKDRAISLQVDYLKSQGFRAAVISSTGNAAISALYYCQKNSINLTVFVSSNINPEKLKLIQAQTKNIVISAQPISDSFRYSRQNLSYLIKTIN